MKHNIWKLGDFTTPIGTHLEPWESFRDWGASIGRIKRRVKPAWYTSLEEETLERATSESRVLRKDCWEDPLGINLDEPFCLCEPSGEYLSIAFPIERISTNESDELRVHLYDARVTGQIWTLQNKRIALIELESNNLSRKYGALISLDGITQPSHKLELFTYTNDTHNALLKQCTMQTQQQLSKLFARENSEGSMLSDTTIGDQQHNGPESTTTIQENARCHSTHKNMLFDTCSDGSVYKFGKDTTLAGCAAVRLHEGSRQVSRQSIPSHRVWTSPTSLLNYNPERVESADAEAKGLERGIRKWFPNPPLIFGSNRHAPAATPHLHVLDNQSVLKAISNPTHPKHIRHSFREYNHYTIGNIRAQLVERGYYEKTANEHISSENATVNNAPQYDTQPTFGVYGRSDIDEVLRESTEVSPNSTKNIRIEWIKGHSGNKLHECADRNAARAAFRHTMEPERMPRDTRHKFALHFYECLVTGDVRQHVKAVCALVWYNKWAQLESQGRMARHLSFIQNKLPSYTPKGTPPRISKFFAKLINSVAHTPHREHTTGRKIDPSCPVCMHSDATAEHVLMECTAPKLVLLRDKLEDKILDSLREKPHIYDQSHPPSLSPINGMSNRMLYPYATNLHHKDIVHIIRALPEARWYRESKKRQGMTTIQKPIIGEQRVMKHHQVSIPTTTFWTLIAWHQMTHLENPLPISEYDARADNIWTAVTKSKETSGDRSLCWTADRLLLDIFIDECGCERELFSNVLNTYHRFKKRCMLFVHQPFAENAGLETDGLRLEAYEGSVYGNPPFDGRHDTIRKTLDTAEEASMCRTGFRAVFFLPLSAVRLAERCMHPRAKLLMKFPDDSIPFIPDDYWYGGSYTAGCYRQSHTHLVILMYESENIGSLKPVKLGVLQDKLAAWFMHITPFRNHNLEAIKFTTIPITSFQKLQLRALPTEWKFWRKGIVLPDNLNVNYPGATFDSSTKSTPFRDIIKWDRLAAHVGFFPDSFDTFLGFMGIPVSKQREIILRLNRIMKDHSYNIFKIFWKLQRQALNNNIKNIQSSRDEIIDNIDNVFLDTSPKPQDSEENQEAVEQTQAREVMQQTQAKEVVEQAHMQEQAQELKQAQNDNSSPYIGISEELVLASWLFQAQIEGENDGSSSNEDDL